MELVRPIPQSVPEPVTLDREAVHDRSALAAARLHRQLTVEEAARRAGLAPDQVQWLEEGRVYRFPSADAALEATLLLAAALDIQRAVVRSVSPPCLRSPATATSPWASSARRW